MWNSVNIATNRVKKHKHIVFGVQGYYMRCLSRRFRPFGVGGQQQTVAHGNVISRCAKLSLHMLTTIMMIEPPAKA